MLANLSTQNAADVAIMGDFNHPEIDWESVTREKNLNHSSQHFIDTIRYAYIRRQRVIVNGKLSSWVDILSGIIPQGSVLCSILFVIFLNDLPAVVSSTAKIFADDTKLFREIRTIEDHDVCSWTSTALWNDRTSGNWGSTKPSVRVSI